MNEITQQQSEQSLALHQEALAFEDDSFDGFGSKSYNFLKITQNDKFLALENGVETELGDAIDVIILTAYPKGLGNTSKKYYDKSGEIENRAPDCASANGFKPDSLIENPQSNSCDICPQNAWGSVVGYLGKGGRACSYYKRLIVVTFHPNAKGHYKIYRLDIPKMSLKNISTYNKICKDGGHTVRETVCTLSFERVTEKRIQTIKFAKKAVLSDEQKKAILHILKTDSTIKELGELESASSTVKSPEKSKSTVKKEKSQQKEEDIPVIDGIEDLDKALDEVLMEDEDAL